MYGQYKICLWTIYSAFFTREQAKLKKKILYCQT